MALAASEVRVAGTGKVYLAKKSGGAAVTMPTDVDTALPAAFIELGYVTTDGVTFSFNRESTDLDAWQGDKLRVLTTKEPKSCEFALMQSSKDVLEAAFGGGTVVTVAAVGPATLDTHTFTPPAKGVNQEVALVIEFTDDLYVYRYCFPRAQQEGEVTFTLTRAEALTYPITFGVLDNTPPWTLVTNDPAFA